MTRFRPKEASEYLFRVHGLRRAPRTLANLRYKGGGPRYTRPTAVEILYAQEDLDAWADALTAQRFSHTAEESIPHNV
jgi:hypothetical protein